MDYCHSGSNMDLPYCINNEITRRRYSDQIVYKNNKIKWLFG